MFVNCSIFEVGMRCKNRNNNNEMKYVSGPNRNHCKNECNIEQSSHFKAGNFGRYSFGEWEKETFLIFAIITIESHCSWTKRLSLCLEQKNHLCANLHSVVPIVNKYFKYNVFELKPPAFAINIPFVRTAVKFIQSCQWILCDNIWVAAGS